MVDGYATYRNAHVYEGMDPQRLILMLYEGALKHIRLAKEGMEENDLKKRGEHLGRVIAIVSELNSSLDSKVQDESISFLRGLYAAMLRELPKVPVNNDVKTLDRTLAYLARLKDIWENDVMGNRAKKQVSEEVSDKKEEMLPAQPQSASYGKMGGGGYSSEAVTATGGRCFSV